MNVLHISTSDIGGGAAIAAYRLHRALRDAGVSSCMAVSSRRSGDPDVIYSAPPSGDRARIWKRLDQVRFATAYRVSGRRVSPMLDYFSDDRVPGPDPLATLPAADVVHLHWVANLVDYTRFFGRLRPGQPLVWTLHDMNPFTGGCHYTMGCERFLIGCGDCPLLGSGRRKDLTRQIFARKEAALARLDPMTTCIVAPSRWLAEDSRRSPLLGRFRVEVIPNGVDTEVFRPRDRRVAREVFGLPQDSTVLLFVADNLGNFRKGLDLLRSALAAIPQWQNVTLAAIGSGADGLPEGTVPLGRIENERLMSFAYSAADVFVLPTRQEAFGLVLIEANACGVPAVSFRLGGVPDVIRHCTTGLLAEPGDAISLRDSILELLADPKRRARMGAAARDVAVRDFAETVVARRYAALYRDLLGGVSGMRAASMRADDAEADPSPSNNMRLPG